MRRWIQNARKKKQMHVAVVSLVNIFWNLGYVRKIMYSTNNLLIVIYAHFHAECAATLNICRSITYESERAFAVHNACTYASANNVAG